MVYSIHFYERWLPCYLLVTVLGLLRLVILFRWPIKGVARAVVVQLTRHILVHTAWSLNLLADHIYPLINTKPLKDVAPQRKRLRLLHPEDAVDCAKRKENGLHRL